LELTLPHRYGPASRVCLDCGYSELEVAERRAPLDCATDFVPPMTMTLLEQHEEVLRRIRARGLDLTMSLYADERMKLLGDLRGRALAKRDIIHGIDTRDLLRGIDLTTGFVSHVVTYDPETGVRYERIVMHDKPRTAEQINDACAGNRPMPPAKPVNEGPSGPTRYKHWTDKS
jgi:hypothetical protein